MACSLFSTKKVDHGTLSSLVWQVCEPTGSLNMERGKK